MDRLNLIADIAARINGIDQDHPVRVAVDGVDAAGKTTLADALVPLLEMLGRPVIRSSIDGFHHPAAIRYKRGSTSPEGYYRDSFDYEGLVDALLKPLGPGGSRRYRRAIFDFRADAPVVIPIQEAAPNAVLVFDGVFLLRPEIREYWDCSIFVRADFAVTVARALQRDGGLFGSLAAAQIRYQERYIPGHRLYLSEVNPEQFASVLVDNNDPKHPVLARAATGKK